MKGKSLMAANRRAKEMETAETIYKTDLGMKVLEINRIEGKALLKSQDGKTYKAKLTNISDKYNLNYCKYLIISGHFDEKKLTIEGIAVID